MKTIKLPDSLADALIATGKELATQNNLGTAWPIWYVTEIKKIQRPEGEGDHKERKDTDSLDETDLCFKCVDLWREDNELPDDCDNWGCRDSFWWYDEEREFASYGSEFFLTQKACQEYIDANRYHFNEPRPYAGSAFRNHEIQPIIQALILAAGEEVPSNHYGVVEND